MARKKTFLDIHNLLEGKIKSVFDDKISVVNAALLASEEISTAYQVYLMDREGVHCTDPTVNELKRQFPNFDVINSFKDLRGLE